MAWSLPRADRGLSRSTSVFHTTICVYKNFSRSVEIWQYEGQKPVLEQKRSTAKPHRKLLQEHCRNVIGHVLTYRMRWYASHPEDINTPEIIDDRGLTANIAIQMLSACVQVYRTMSKYVTAFPRWKRKLCETYSLCVYICMYVCVCLYVCIAGNSFCWE